MTPPRVEGLVVITDRDRARHPLPEICAAALGAGFRAVMLREKDLPGRPLWDLARELAAVCARHRGLLVVNDRVDVALAIPGAGAHLGRGGIPVAAARSLLGPERRIGYSAHEVAEARAALEAGADYVTLSPVFPSISKPDYPPRGEAFLARGCAQLPAGRVLALGGVTADTVAGARRAGAAGAAVMGAVMQAGDPGAACRALVAAWGAGPGPRA